MTIWTNTVPIVGKSYHFMRCTSKKWNNKIEVDAGYSSYIKETSLDIDKRFHIEHIDNLNEKRIYETLITHGFRGFLHETTFNNLCLILNDGLLGSREWVLKNHPNFDDSAMRCVIEQTSSFVKGCARLYFRTGTPTNYIFEDKIRDLVYLVFNWKITHLPGAEITSGNARSINTEHWIVKDNYLEIERNIDWDKVFDFTPVRRSEADGLVTVSNKNERQTELLVPNKVPLRYLQKIVFRNDNAINSFKKMVDEDVLEKYENKFISDPTFFER